MRKLIGILLVAILLAVGISHTIIEPQTRCRAVGTYLETPESQRTFRLLGAVTVQTQEELIEGVEGWVRKVRPDDVWYGLTPDGSSEIIVMVWNTGKAHVLYARHVVPHLTCLFNVEEVKG